MLAHLCCQLKVRFYVWAWKKTAVACQRAGSLLVYVRENYWRITNRAAARAALGCSGMSGKDHTAIVKVQGVIADNQDASANTVVTGLRNAFESKHTKAVLMVINSPGGSPVQSNYIYDEMKRLRT